jgi:hypothetical protein
VSGHARDLLPPHAVLAQECIATGVPCTYGHAATQARLPVARLAFGVN